MNKNRKIITMLKFIISVFKIKYKIRRRALKDFFYGITAYEIELEFNKEKNRLNNLLMLMIFGDLAGLPFFPSYYSMRILPYVIPIINKWKRSMQREKDIIDLFSSDI